MGIGPSFDLRIAPGGLAQAGGRVWEVGSAPELGHALRGDAEVIGDLLDRQPLLIGGSGHVTGS
jgi:hypothetical protein